MKTLRLFGLFCLFAVMILGTAGCSDDDEELGSSIVGAWQSEIHTYRIWVFTSNGEVVSEDEYGTYRLNGNRLYISWTDEYGDYEEAFLIVELTSDTMVLDELDDDGIAHDDPETYRRIDMGND
ncbi:MAG: lipocalin family protein [Bacteroides sp.]|uniref:lipocalin family protein n=1 Tax=Phocaeicola barnesiae TaxID=376804 RepID=UPI001D3FA954|nr:lipocalin family protein [Phocaeicola barnesiae]MBS6468027.1 lipocalin family protein [Bacteroides sp.]MCD7816926.1 lipocalin family protein [Bacteroides sp.]HJG77506.1 lipocalin family protein [Phocaeicola barnesiae]